MCIGPIPCPATYWVLGKFPSIFCRVTAFTWVSSRRTQEVARAYNAQCTPDFFGFNARDELQYRGRLDASGTSLVPNARRELYEAMKQVADTGRGPHEQTPSIGCSIKWRG